VSVNCWSRLQAAILGATLWRLETQPSTLDKLIGAGLAAIVGALLISLTAKAEQWAGSRDLVRRYMVFRLTAGGDRARRNEGASGPTGTEGAEGWPERHDSTYSASFMTTSVWSGSSGWSETL
jgi:hypothetical protein